MFVTWGRDKGDHAAVDEGPVGQAIYVRDLRVEVEWEAQTGICQCLTSTFEKPYWCTSCPGHAGVKGNDRADRLAGKATVTGGLHLGRSEVVRSLRRYLRAQSRGHHTINRLGERREAYRNRKRSTRGRERSHRQSDRRWNRFKGNIGGNS